MQKNDGLTAAGFQVMPIECLVIARRLHEAMREGHPIQDFRVAIFVTCTRLHRGKMGNALRDDFVRRNEALNRFLSSLGQFAVLKRRGY